MTGKELIAYLRETILDDVYLPQLWTDPELLRLLSSAEEQACRRAHLIVDSSTADDNDGVPLCRITITAGTSVYTMSKKILQILRCQLQSMTEPLRGPVQHEELDGTVSGWMGTSGTVASAGTGGSPEMFLFDASNKLTFVLNPSAGDTANLTVARLPLVAIALQTAPEIDDEYHLGLCHWAAHLAFLKPDSETFNVDLSRAHAELFERQFGPLPDAYQEKVRKMVTRQQRMRPRVFGS